MAIQQFETPFKQKVTILNDSKYALEGDPIEGTKPGRPPKLNFEVHGNYPRIRIRLNNGQQGEAGRIDLALDLVALSAIIEMIDQAAKSQQPMSNAIEVKKRGFDRQTNKPTEPYTQALIVIGRSQEGNVFFGVQRGNKNSKNYLKLNFHFAPPEFHPVINLQTGQPAERSVVSTLIARAWVRILSELMFIVNANLWNYNETWEAKQAAKNGDNNNGSNGYSSYTRNNASNDNSGGYSNAGASYGNGNSGGGYNNPAPQAPAANFDDDIPFN